MTDYLFVFTSQPHDTVHVEFVATADSRQEALQKLKDALLDRKAHIGVSAEPQGNKLYISVDCPGGVRVNIALRPAGAFNAEDVYEFTCEEEPPDGGCHCAAG